MRDRSLSSTRRRLAALAVALLLVAGACASTGGTSTPSAGDSAPSSSATTTGTAPSSPSSSGDPASPGAPIPEDRRVEIIDEVLGFVGSLPGADPEADHEEIARYLADRPEFIDAGVSEDQTVWGVFTDGRLYVHVDNRRDPDDGTAAPASSEPGDSAAAPASPPAAAPAVFRAAAGAELPGSLQVSVLNGLSPSYGPPAERFGPWLSEAGYAVSVSDATIERLRGVSGDGVFYYTGHGGLVTPRLGPDAGTKVYLLVSTTSISAENSVTYAEDLEAGRVVYASAPVGDNPGYAPDDPDCKDPKKREKLQKCDRELWKGFYGISERFIREYWSFADGALVILDACTSDVMSGLVLGLGNVGAFGGWTGTVTPSGSGMIIDLFFDRLLGKNVDPPDEDPDVRPFDAKTVATYLGKKDGRDEDPKSPGTRFVVSENIPTILVPSIATMEVAEATGELFIDGLFGSRTGEVTIAGTTVPTKTWNLDMVTTELEDTGPGSAGTVQVVVDGRKSNEVPLTEWRGTVTYEASYDGLAKGLLATVTLNLHLRADVHLARELPWKKPQPRRVYLEAAGDSDAPWSMAGSGRIGDTKLELSGSGVMEPEVNQPDHDQALFLATGTLVADDPHVPPKITDVQFHMHLSSNPTSRLEITEGGTSTTAGLPLAQSNILKNPHFELNDRFDIAEGLAEGDTIGVPGIARLVWSPFAARFAPSLDDPPPG